MTPVLTKLSDVRRLIERWNLRPQKPLGQNFLIDANILGILLETAAVSAADRVIEVGPGLGVVTEPLARSAGHVVAVEKDPRLWPLLEERLAPYPNVDLVRGDILELDLERLLGSGIDKVVSNLPYSVGSAILVNFVRAAAPPASLTVTLQQEVADRLTAAPGCKAFGLLTLWTQLRYDVSIRKLVNPGCFYPAPGVRSAILSLKRRAEPDPLPQERAFFYALTKRAFAGRRKQLGTVLAQAGPALARAAREGAPWREAGIDPRTRPEELGVSDWLRLSRALNPGGESR